ncbi:hypothetical protein GTW51_11990 [Aurantimonas aggregata]|uniref:Secreted protein n=1 Tax=Aurantimonas aggregata TaxID=2047720 RepID=A0A6L9MHV3_9HYPH|nr:hypothetical protein [Aurantimonas aggregata]NDV87419.1 hypothetical protein [Aurantimonas aggregata]
MKIPLFAAGLLALGTVAAAAQSAPPEMGAPQPTPTCAEALPQIQSLIDQASQAGLDTSGAAAHVAEAETARGADDENGCIRSLVLAQNDVLEKAQAAAPAAGEAPAAPPSAQ